VTPIDRTASATDLVDDAGDDPAKERRPKGVEVDPALVAGREGKGAD
jgi:hypothetical protein